MLLRCQSSRARTINSICVKSDTSVVWVFCTSVAALYSVPISDMAYDSAILGLMSLSSTVDGLVLVAVAAWGIGSHDLQEGAREP